MDRAIVTAFMVIVSVVCAVLVFNAVYPAVIQSSHAMVSMKSRVDERLKTQIVIIHATGNGSDAFVWVKNVGSLRIVPIERCDVFFGPEGNFSRIPHEDNAGGSKPYWNYGVEGNGSGWTPTATLKITIYYDFVLSGRYFVKVVIPNGLSDEDYFSVDQE